MSAARFRYTLVAGATSVVIGSGFTVAGLRTHASQNTAGPPPAALETGPPAPLIPAPNLGPPEEPSTPPSSATPSPTKTTKAPKSKPKAKTKPRAIAAPETSGSVIDQVLAHINAARAEEGKKALTLDAKLSRASELHNQKMINGCGLSHQCSGEKGLERFGDQGVRFRTAGENIGYRSGGSSNGAQVKAANLITDSMLAEKPPEDGHRKNLLNGSFTRIGLAVTRDGKGLVWFTQDFVG